MGLKSLAAKLADYQTRLEDGATCRIRPEHVRKVLDKLRHKEATLMAEIGETDDPDRKARLDRKLGVARDHVRRAEWLLDQLS